MRQKHTGRNTQSSHNVRPLDLAVSKWNTRFLTYIFSNFKPLCFCHPNDEADDPLKDAFHV